MITRPLSVSALPVTATAARDIGAVAPAHGAVAYTMGMPSSAQTTSLSTASRSCESGGAGMA